MPGVESDSDAAARDQMVVEALECFRCSSVQSYEQFLGSFTHLSPGGAGSRHATVAPQVNRLPRETEGSGECRQRRRSRATDVAEERDPVTRRQADCCVLPADQEEIVLSDGMTAGGGGNEGCFPPGATLKVDNYLDVGDFSLQEEDNVTTDPGGVGGVLPGEVEEEVSAYMPSFCHLTQLELTSTARGTGAGTQGQRDTRESESEEVMPFSLDEDFDYDHVVLSHKHPITKTTAGQV